MNIPHHGRYVVVFMRTRSSGGVVLERSTYHPRPQYHTRSHGTEFKLLECSERRQISFIGVYHTLNYGIFVYSIINDLQFHEN